MVDCPNRGSLSGVKDRLLNLLEALRASLWLLPALMALSFLPIPVIVVGSIVYQRRLEPRYARVREAVGTPAKDIVLVPAGTQPKTSSGKLQRSLCRDQYLKVELDELGRS